MLAPRELWRYRDLALQIAVRDITVRYRQTALGAAWAVLQPIGFMVVFSLIFGASPGISSDGLPYALFSLAALVPWTFFANALPARLRQPGAATRRWSRKSTSRGSSCPPGVVAAGFVDLAISLVILLIIVLVCGHSCPRRRSWPCRCWS